ncbi:SDR family NAD(P)-dependent oxidoreductase [Paeniglutamicibacter sp. ABSL32-1]|uniref:SDR family NAD(P)-dependent oxidoreductase n=1 Tax=Paeniglutamicibacter quisquiliarum TaxID=2849498 RepID=UPI001C2D7BC7|nr:SDR family NAD(P)-dependent oxidoreductase [Paeniglutamicibacter quisquiliarum]MBV1780062.1 SDR family NAD(P)-dependent oxidoreductase [Paeniglutamicibacter quisquiliarum]
MSGKFLRSRDRSESLAGKVVFITGAAGGIALATVEELALFGAKTALIDRDQSTLEAIVDRLPGDHLGIVADVGDYSSLQDAVARTVEHFGAIDVVFACAGIGSASTVAASDIEALTRIIDINLCGVMRTVKACLKEVTRSQGYVLLMSSAAALKNVPRANAYAASKSGVEAFGGALRLELAHKGVAVGVAHPAWVSTGMISGSSARGAEGRSLPWPFSVVSSTKECAQHLVGAMEHRKRKVFIPGALALFDPLRWLSTGPLWDRFMAGRARRNVTAWEAGLAPPRT